jgi:hypothetical protein
MDTDISSLAGDSMAGLDIPSIAGSSGKDGGEDEKLDFQNMFANVMDSGQKGDIVGKLFTSDSAKTKENQLPSFIKITEDEITILVDGKQGFTITKDGVKQSGKQNEDGLPSDSQGTMWNDNLAQMSFIPSTCATPVPAKTPRNPLSILSGLIGII